MEMLNGDSSSDYCPICYEMFDNCKPVTFKNCNHQLCMSCTNAIALDEHCQCPLDREQPNHFIVDNVMKTLNRYRYDSLSKSEAGVNFMGQIWTTFLSISSQYIYGYSELLSVCKINIENICSKQSHIIIDELEEFKTNFIEIFKHRKRITEEFQVGLRKVAFLFHILREEHNEIQSIMHKSLSLDTNILLSMSMIFNDWWEKYTLSMLDNFEVNRCKLLMKILVNIDCAIHNVNDMTKRLTWFIIFKVNNNRKLFKFHQPHFDETFQNRCLVCVKLIEIYNYAKFSQCNHKICWECVKGYGVSRGCCPFDNDKSDELIINKKINSHKQIIETSSAYIARNYHITKFRNIKLLIKCNLEIISKLLKLQIYFPRIIEATNQILSTENQSLKVRLLHSLENQFLSIQNDRRVYPHSLALTHIVLNSQKACLEIDDNASDSALMKALNVFINSSSSFLFHFTEDWIFRDEPSLEETLMRVTKFKDFYEDFRVSLIKMIVMLSNNVSRYTSDKSELLLYRMKEINQRILNK